MDRQVRAIRNEEEKVKRSLKQAAAKGDRDTCTILAKEIVRSRKATNRIFTTKAHLNSVQMQMKNQLATLRVAGALAKSSEVMQAMQNLVRVTEISGIMREMSKEMMKAGIIEEMLDETMESVEDTEDLEEEVQSEVDKASILYILNYMKINVLWSIMRIILISIVASSEETMIASHLNLSIQFSKMCSPTEVTVFSPRILYDGLILESSLRIN